MKSAILAAILAASFSANAFEVTIRNQSAKPIHIVHSEGAGCHISECGAFVTTFHNDGRPFLNLVSVSGCNDGAGQVTVYHDSGEKVTSYWWIKSGLTVGDGTARAICAVAKLRG